MSSCFGALPGGASAFAEAFAANVPQDACTDVAKRTLSEASAGSGHLSKGYAWYLSKSKGPSVAETVIDQMRRPGKHVYHVAQENLDDDMDGLWDWLCVANPPTAESDGLEDATSERGIARHADTTLSDKGRAALTAYLQDEYYYLNIVNRLSENTRSSAIDGMPTTTGAPSKI